MNILLLLTGDTCTAEPVRAYSLQAPRRLSVDEFPHGSAVFSLCGLSPREDYARLIKTNNSVSPPRAKQVSSIIQERRPLYVIAPFPSFLCPPHNAHLD